MLINENVVNASKILCECYVQSRYIPPADDWPPYHPKHYTPLTIVHHRGRRTETEVLDFAQKFKIPAGITVEDPDFSSIDHKIASINELFAPFDGTILYPYMILIEGAPGTGKTNLSKEIAFQWANKKVLSNRSLMFLLFMRDPQVKNLIDVQSLVKYFLEDESLTNEVTKWLMVTGGKYLTIILDGYDEMSDESKACFITDGIIGRNKLPNCGIVITSRPAASLHFHNIVNCRAEILGFTEKDRHNFIQSALVNQNDKIKKLSDYLASNPSLNALCYTPLNMSILLCLTEGGISTLPKTQTMLYQQFIVMTIVHFLKKDRIIFTTTPSTLHDLPSPYDQAIKELSQFAFLSLKEDQLVFTLAEVTAKYPNLTPANWYRLGLLKPAQYFKPQDACDHESFHFLHYSMQEYMAAYYIASLKNNKLLSLLKETFWNVRYFNTWVMYIGITGGRHFTFTHFLSGNYFFISSWLFRPKISNKILSDKIKCLHLLRCSGEADCKILSSVENIFHEDIINLSNSSLSVNDIHALAMLLLTLPNKQWQNLNLSGCNIYDDGCELLCKIFVSKNAMFKIKSVDLSNNSIQWESLCELCKVFKLWDTEELIISIDSLYDRRTVNEINSFISKLRKSVPTRITGKLFSVSILLCTYIAKQKVMVVAYSEPDSVKIFKYSNCELNNIAIERLKDLISQQIGLGTIDQINFIYRFSYDELLTQSITLHQHIGKVIFCGSNMHSKGAYMISTPFDIYSTNSTPRYQVIDYLTAIMCHNIQSKSSYLKAIPQTLRTIDNLQNIFCGIEKIMLSGYNINEEIADDIAAILLHTTKLRKLRVGANNLQAAGAVKIARGLQNTSNLTVLDLNGNNISEEAAEGIAAVLSHNTKLQELYLHRNNLQLVGAIKVAKGLLNTSNLTILSFGNNNISEEAANDIADVLSHNTKLQKLYLGGNNLQTRGVIKISNNLKNMSNLTVLDLNDNNVSHEAADDIAAVLSHNAKTQKLGLGGNNLLTPGAIKIAKGLQNVSNLMVIRLDDNNIDEEAAHYIAAVLSHNTRLQEIYLNGNNLQTAGAIKIAKSLQNTSSLTVFNLNHNNISEEAADHIAAVLSHNTKLLELHLSGNNLQASGGIKIAKGLQNVSNLTVLILGNNNISEEATNDIGAVLSHNTMLQKLDLSGNDLQTQGAINIAKSLSNIFNLTVLNLCNNNISEEASDDIAAVLSHNAKLKILALSENNLQTGGIINIAQGLQNVTNIIALDLNHNSISKEAADDLSSVLSWCARLQELYLCGNNLQTAGAIKIAKALQNVSNLTAINLNDNNIGKEAAHDIAAVLSHNPEMQMLYLGGNNLQTEGIIKIANSLQNASNLVAINFNNNNVSEEAADDLARVLFLNTKLQQLYLGGNKLQPEGTITVAQGLHNTSNLISINLNHVNISKEGTDEIAAVLLRNTKLQELHISGNNLQVAGSIKIAEGLQKTFNLRILDLNQNSIGQEAADKIATVLSHNTNLQELYLGGNNLQTEGAIKIAKGLQNTSSLTVFNVNHNNISKEAADEISAVLSHNTKLQELYLDGNNLQTEGAMKIAKGLQNTSNLTVFNLNYDSVGEAAADDIEAILSCNTKLQELYIGKNNLQAGDVRTTKDLQDD